jgi:diguanylate cyclase (GGDEF)-like protein
MTETMSELSSPALTDTESMRWRAFRLIHDLQAGLPHASIELRALGEQAAAMQFEEVERACLFGDAVAAWIERDPRAAEIVEQLIATSDGDLAMLALGLAMRSEPSFGGHERRDPSEQEQDLAQAVVLLEESKGGVLERISGHTACSIAFGSRLLFELADEQCAAAFALAEPFADGVLDFIIAPVAFNKIEWLVSWASVLRQLDDTAGVVAIRESWDRSVEASRRYEMSPSWRRELHALGLVLRSISGEDTALEAQTMLSEPPNDIEQTPRTPPVLHLAIAVSDADADRPNRSDAARCALNALDADLQPQLYDLALHLTARAEMPDSTNSALVYGRRQLATSWERRSASLGAMRSRIRSERFVQERDLLMRHAHVDELTGISNRRAFDQFLESATHLDRNPVSIVIFDVDQFKTVNDRHGHFTGDQVLVAVANVLTSSIRHRDLAARLGGDEFAVVLVGTDADSAAARARNILQAFSADPASRLGEDHDVCLSAGVASGDVDRVQELWHEADSAMYQAKAAGGNRVVTASLNDD